MTIPGSIEEQITENLPNTLGSATTTNATTVSTSPVVVPAPTPIPIPSLRGEGASRYCGGSILADKNVAKEEENGTPIVGTNLYKGYYASWALAQTKRAVDRKFDLVCLDFKDCGGANVDCFQYEDQWRDCKTRRILRSEIPDGYLELKFQNGTTCWEGDSVLQFSPDIGTALFFQYHRGNTLPQPVNIKVFNPSGFRPYSISFTTNQEIIFSRSSFVIMPRKTETFTVTVPLSLLDKMGDGTSRLELEIIVNEVG